MIKKLMFSLGTGLLVSGIFTLMTPAKMKSDFDVASLSNQVQQLQATSDNHGARITNVEKDVTALQQNTGSQPAVDHVAVPSATSITVMATVPPAGATASQTPTVAAPSAPTPPPAPTVINSTYKVAPADATGQCAQWETDTYSDGTTKTFIVGYGCYAKISN